jgi:hypothetical protein
MNQTPENYYDALPCNHCGSHHMTQQITRTESVYLDDDGEINEIKPQDTIDVQAVWCTECDEKVWEP